MSEVKPRNKNLEDIYTYLGIFNTTDKRLLLKANLMRRVLEYVSEWKQDNKKIWIDKLATRLNLSTRKVMEDYVNPLISDSILEEDRALIVFAGLPNDVLAIDLNTAQLQQELEEENEHRREQRQPEVSMEEWVKIRPKRFVPVG